MTPEEKKAAKQAKKLREAKKYLADEGIRVGGRGEWKPGADVAATFARRRAELEQAGKPVEEPKDSVVTSIKEARK